MIWGLVNGPDLPRTHEKITGLGCIFLCVYFLQKNTYFLRAGYQPGRR